MLLIIQIILTIIAWTKGGWKWLSLLPIGIALILGFTYGAAGGDPSSPIVAVFDVLAAIALAIMCFTKNPKNIKPPTTEL